MNELQKVDNNQLEVVDNKEIVALVKGTVFPTATDSELKFFVHKCTTLGVDPLSQMIHPTKYRLKDGTTRITFVASIDFLRARAESSGKYDGQDEITYEHKDNSPYPYSATAKVYKKGINRPFVCTALWSEFYPGDAKGHMYKKMPRVMLGKCAEAQALRKAFPAVLDKLYIQEEIGQSNEQTDNTRPNVEFTVEDKPKQVKKITPTGVEGNAIVITEETKPGPEKPKEKKKPKLKTKKIDGKLYTISDSGTERRLPTGTEQKELRLISIEQGFLLIGECKKQGVPEDVVCKYAGVESVFFITWSKDTDETKCFEYIFDLVKNDPGFFIGDVVVDKIIETFNGQEPVINDNQEGGNDDGLF